MQTIQPNINIIKKYCTIGIIKRKKLNFDIDIEARSNGWGAHKIVGNQKLKFLGNQFFKTSEFFFPTN